MNQCSCPGGSPPEELGFLHCNHYDGDGDGNDDDNDNDDGGDDDDDDTPAMTVRSRDFSMAAIPCPGDPLTPENHTEKYKDG